MKERGVAEVQIRLRSDIGCCRFIPTRQALLGVIAGVVRVGLLKNIKLLHGLVVLRLEHAVLVCFG